MRPNRLERRTFPHTNKIHFYSLSLNWTRWWMNLVESEIWNPEFDFDRLASGVWSLVSLSCHVTCHMLWCVISSIKNPLFFREHPESRIQTTVFFFMHFSLVFVWFGLVWFSFSWVSVSRSISTLGRLYWSQFSIQLQTNYKTTHNVFSFSQGVTVCYIHVFWFLNLELRALLQIFIRCVRYTTLFYLLRLLES